MFRYHTALALAAILAPIAHAQTAPQPKLVVAIAVDQLSADLFSEYRPLFADGFKRLQSGVVFPRGHQSHAATETCPGHSTILTGSRPARTGIIANEWQVPTSERKDSNGHPVFQVYCAEKPSADASVAEASPQFLRVPTLGDRLKAKDPRTRVASISGKDRAAIMLGGHNADLELWWDGSSFTTYKSRESSIPREVIKVSERARKVAVAPTAPKLPVQCTAKSLAVPIGTTHVGTLQNRVVNHYLDWYTSVDFDAFTLDAALATMRAMQLGHGPATDVLAVSFSATDYVGHAYGTEGAEMCTHLLALDHIIGRLLTALDQSRVSYMVMLTADHGGHDLPERNNIHGLPAAQRVDAALTVSRVGEVVMKQLQLHENPLIGRASFGDMYLSTNVPADKRAAVLEAAVRVYRSHEQVAAVFTKSELIVAPAPSGPVDEWTLLERAKASFDPERSGDFIVLLKEFVTPVPEIELGLTATHGSPWGYDRRVPILFWWRGVRGFEQPNAVETADILPTLASFIGLDVPTNEIDGRCLDLMAGKDSNCRSQKLRND